jgi:hypothetical protein
MGGILAPVEVSATQEVSASSTDLAAAAAAVAEQESAPMETAPIEMEVQDLPASHAAVEIAPAAFDAPQMEVPALEQPDPGAGLEPPPGESGMDQVEGAPLP